MERIRLVHGNGGKFSHELVDKYIVKYFSNPILNELHDGAVFPVTNGRMAMSTDSYVVTPHIFPGGNIGKLAVCGTVNDLAMMGAIPQYLSCGLILEEGLPISTLETVLQTMSDMAQLAGVSIVTGDTKVVEKGSVDDIYINTAGVGIMPDYVQLGTSYIESGMKVIVSGTLGDHAIAVMGTRYGLDLPDTIQTDCAPLHKMAHKLLETFGKDIAFFRDPTRGGLATTLQEIANSAQKGIRLQESAIPVREEVQAVCQVLGYDPLYLANEGKMIAIVRADVANDVVQVMRTFTEGRDAVIIGDVVSGNAGKVGLQTAVGGIRLLDMLGEDQVPRIC
jgi:hydrogenase expression/formation protein hypE